MQSLLSRGLGLHLKVAATWRRRSAGLIFLGSATVCACTSAEHAVGSRFDGPGTQPVERGSTSPESDPARAPCSSTTDCRGGEFCDRGLCGKLDTAESFGHGYGAQCVGEEFYPDDVQPGGSQALHCRSYLCVDGHCSSCLSDEECRAGERCISAEPHPRYPDAPAEFVGKRCEADDHQPRAPCGTTDNPNPCVSSKPEQPEPLLASNAASECRAIGDCSGDWFCDRGRCAPVLVDPAGHGYGAQFVRREPPSTRDTCLGFISVARVCSSCLADSECFPEAPYCARVPHHPESTSCSPHPEHEYYNNAGEVAPTFSGVTGSEIDAWIREYRILLEWHPAFVESRLQAGLPVPPERPPLERGLAE
jgi:hypothetical protein